jgi:hypothetical protein
MLTGRPGIDCRRPVKSRALEQSFGEAEVECTLWLKSQSKSYDHEMLSLRMVRTGRGTTWRPLTRNGYLSKASILSSDRGDHLDLPAELQPALARILGTPLDVEEWETASRAKQADERVAAAGG